MKLQDFDYPLPKELIAQTPAHKRDDSRLMVVDRSSGRIEHTVFHELPGYLNPGDLIVANNTRVIPARLFGTKKTGGWVELFLLNFLENGSAGSQIWEGLLKSRRKIDAPSTVFFSEQLRAEILEHMDSDTWRVQLYYQGNLEEALSAGGKTPLPPYIKRSRLAADDPADRERYQTVYARHNGAVAAPTAGLHFTRSLMDVIQQQGTGFAYITLHVGYGTFQTIREEEALEAHSMHSETFQVTEEEAARVNSARQDGNRIIAVGTTATRTLETMTGPDGILKSGRGSTDLFIYPGYSFNAVDRLITNFHLPKSSLLLLVSAFAGKELIMQAYHEAVKKKYRFFSYGDAMLIL